MKSAKCLECGFVGWADAECCKRCGAPVLPQLEGDGEIAPAPSYDYQHDENAPAPSYDYQVNRNQVSPEVKQGLAIASLVLGILNFMFLGIFGVTIIVGIVLSVVALKKIKRFPHLYGGHGYAVAGLVTNIVSVVILIPILVIAAVAIPNLLASRRAANEGSAISSLRRIQSGQATYQSTTGAGKFGTLSDLQRENLIAPELVSEVRHGYRFKVETVSDRGDGWPGFVAVAVPSDYPRTGRRSFFVDESGVLRGGDIQGGEPTKYDAPLNLDSDDRGERSASRRSRRIAEE